MTSTIPLSVALTPIRDMYRSLVDAAVGWQADREQQFEPDHFALICVAADNARDTELAPTRWTRTGTYDVLRIAIPNWCSRARCLWPIDLAAAMWTWFDFLDETGRLGPASDPLGEIRKPLLCYGGLDHRGRKLATGAPRPIECECFIPYRESVELLRALTLDAEQRGTDPLDRLRVLVGRPPISPPTLWDPGWPAFDDNAPAS